MLSRCREDVVQIHRASPASAFTHAVMLIKNSSGLYAAYQFYARQTSLKKLCAEAYTINSGEKAKHTRCFEIGANA